MCKMLWVVTVLLLAHGTTPGLAINQDPVENQAVEAVLEELIPVPIAGPFELPWSIGFLPDGSTLITEKSGRLSLVRPDQAPQQIQGLPPILSGSHGGLLDVAVDPEFLTSGALWLSYTHGTEHVSTVRVMRARLDVATHTLLNQQVIFESDPPASGLEQLGGRLWLTPGGFLFLTLGDRFEPRRAQDLTDHAGSIIRIRADGSVPDNNPFVALPGAKPEIWTYGHRNPQGLAEDPQTGQIWAVEHGPQGGDELNLVEGGRNYGWPVISYGLNYDGTPVGIGAAAALGMEQPTHVWQASVAPSGLTVQREGEQALLWLGALAGQSVIRLELKEDRIVGERRFLQGEVGRIRDVRQSPDGFLYVITDDPEGWLYRLMPETEQALRLDRNPL
jgi:aldose sugar dehydrogenase